MRMPRFLLSGLFALLIIFSQIPAFATKWVVNVQNFSFSPSNLPGVIVGDTIRWVWVSGTHTTTSTTIPGGASSWDHPITSTNTFYEYPVTVAGNYNYKCTPHEGMGMVGSFSATAVTPLLISISPNQATQGDSFMATITGSNTNFTGSPAVSLTYSANPGEVITATSVTVISSTILHAQFTIPSNASTGLWTLHVNTLTLVNSFTVIEVVPSIVFMSPNFAHQGDTFNGTVFGQNTTWSGTPSVFLTYSNNPGEIITGTNVVAVSNTEVTATFSIPANASTGNYTIHVDALEQANAFTVLTALVPALSSISPDSGEQGSVVSTTIMAENTAFVGSNPSVSLSLHSNPAEIITGINVVVIDNSTLATDFDIPYEATPGLWDLHVNALTLENSFTVIDVVPFLTGINPDSAHQGEQVTTVITAVNSRFTLSAPVVLLSFSANPAEVITPSNINVISDTQVEAVFDIPVDALVGNWDVNVDDMVLAQGFTVTLLAGIGNPSSFKVTTYPNPAKDLFYVENANGAVLTVFSSNGGTVLSQNITAEKQAVDISHLTRGVYFVRIVMNDNKKVEKLVLN